MNMFLLDGGSHRHRHRGGRTSHRDRRRTLADDFALRGFGNGIDRDQDREEGTA